MNDDKFIVNDDMFGSYVKIQTGRKANMFLYKVIGRIESNKYCDIPITVETRPTLHDEIVPVLNVVHCGVSEDTIIRVALSDCEIVQTPNDPLTLDELREMVDEAVYIVELHVEGKKAMIVDETAYEIVHEYGPSRLVYGYYDIGRYAVIMDVHASAYYKGEKKEGVNFWELGVGPLIYENYGRTWLAYRRKPEEGTK